MRHANTFVAVMLGFGMFSATHSQAETVMPIVAKTRRTVTEVPRSGPPQVKRSTEGEYLRSFDGSYIQWFNQPGLGPVDGMLFDAASGKAYQLHYATRTAVLKSAGRPHDILDVPRDRLVADGREEKFVEGLSCFFIPAMVPEPPTGVSVSGGACYSMEYRLFLYHEFGVTTLSTGTTVLSRTEMYDVEIGRSPSQGAIALPDGFVVQESLCESCARQEKS